MATISSKASDEGLKGEQKVHDFSVNEEVDEGAKAALKSSIKRFQHDHGPGSNNKTQTRLSFASKRKSDVAGVDEPVSTSSANKRTRQSASYAPPTKYAHLSELTDIIEPGLIGLIVGFNPGVKTATAGHAYAHPSNQFWRLMHSSGITDRRLKPEEDGTLPKLYQMGNTNLVSRPSANFAELSKQEMAAGTPVLEEKVRAFKPESVCIVGKGIWDSVWRYRYGREIKKAEFKYGWQDKKEKMGKTKDWGGAWVFVATATSGLAANLKPEEKEAIWKPYGEWVQRRREERKAEAEAEVEQDQAEAVDGIESQSAE